MHIHMHIVHHNSCIYICKWYALIIYHIHMYMEYICHHQYVTVSPSLSLSLSLSLSRSLSLSLSLSHSLTLSLIIINTWPSDPIHDSCSLPGGQIRENNFTYRSVQVSAKEPLIIWLFYTDSVWCICCGRPDTPGSDPQHRIMRYCFYYLTWLGCLFPSD